MARVERDLLGTLEIPDDRLWGIHTERALRNFRCAARPPHPELIHAFGEVKLACAAVNEKLGYLTPEVAGPIRAAAREMADGKLDAHVVVDALQGGAGTSTNLNVCEVIANRALEIAGRRRGEYAFIDPIEHVNLHQSTNDTYPTALRVACYRMLLRLEEAVTRLQEACQAGERKFSGVVKIGRTQLMDAVPLTLGREFGAWAEAFSRDRWRIFKCRERIRVVNLGGTAVGTGLAAPREYIFKVVPELKSVTGFPLARAENLVEATQNCDVFVEVSGILKAHASNLLKVCTDLRLMASGPDAGMAEIRLPALQAGSSIMPGKVNPVVPEMVSQAAVACFAHDHAVTTCASLGNFELNAFMPLIADSLLTMLQLLESSCEALCSKCIEGIEANTERLAALADGAGAMATLLVPVAGYHEATRVARLMAEEGIGLREAVGRLGVLPPDELEALLEPAAINALGCRGRSGARCRPVRPRETAGRGDGSAAGDGACGGGVGKEKER